MRMSISEKVPAILLSNERPATLADLERELEGAKARGYNAGVADRKSVITKEQARAALCKLGISEESSFFQVMANARLFPLGRFDELNTLDQICGLATDSYWNDEYPGFSSRFLELSSPGEGGYLFEKATGHVFDLDQGPMDALMAGVLTPKWRTYSEFLDWYYEFA
jgi:hypothetical protein